MVLRDYRSEDFDALCEIDGLKFIFDTSQREYSRLKGATLDYADEGFVVVEHAD